MLEEHRIIATKRPMGHIMSAEEIAEWDRECKEVRRKEYKWIAIVGGVIFLVTIVWFLVL